MKKLLVMVGILCCLLFSLSSCGSGDTGTEGDVDEAMDTMEDNESLMDQAQEAAEDAAESAEELADEAGEAMKEIAD